MVHWMQRERLRNMDKIKSWIGTEKLEDMDRDGLVQKSVLILGCTRDKAKEYISEIFGDN